MTREEAKRRLLNIERCTPIHTRDDVRDFEALEMAIQALSQEPCDDAISREAAINIASLHCLTIDETVKAIKNLPPVTQKSETVTEFADRCRECGARYGKLLKQKSGKWIEKEFRKEEYVLTGKCSVCGRVRVIDDFCSCCGAKMESEDK